VFRDAPPAGLREWHYRAVLLRFAGDEAGYQAHARAMIERFEASAIDWERRATVRVCCLAPEVPVEPERLLKLASAEQVHRDDPWSQTAAALADVRAGRPEEAVRRLTGIPSGGDYTDLVLTLAHARLGAKAEARRHLDAAGAKGLREVVAALGATPGGLLVSPSSWIDAAMRLTLYREAYAAVHGTAPPEDSALAEALARRRAAFRAENGPTPGEDMAPGR
jgi:hypothetical protein